MLDLSLLYVTLILAGIELLIPLRSMKLLLLLLSLLSVIVALSTLLRIKIDYSHRRVQSLSHRRRNSYKPTMRVFRLPRLQST